MANFVIIANFDTGLDNSEPAVIYGDQQKIVSELATLEAYGYTCEVRKVTAPLTDEALAALRGLSSFG